MQVFLQKLYLIITIGVQAFIKNVGLESNACSSTK